MLCTANIHIHLVPVISGFSLSKRFIVMRIHVTEEIPGGTGIAGHGRGFTDACGIFNLTPNPSDVNPIC